MSASVSNVAVIGASGYIGQATVKALVSKKAKLVVGVRDPKSKKAAPFAEMKGVEVVAMDMSKPKELTTALQSAAVQTVFLVTPGTLDRPKLVADGLKAAKEAGVTHVVTLSFPVALKQDTVFGKQGANIEASAAAAGINCTILRLPLFMDNVFASLESIKGQGKIYGPQTPDKANVAISTSDAGEAAATVLLEPAKHVNKTYTLTSPAFSPLDVAKAFTRATGKEVANVQVPYEAAKKSFMGMGFPEWQTDGVLELFALADQGHPTVTTETGDFKALTGRDATTIDQFADAVGAMFK